MARDGDIEIIGEVALRARSPMYVVSGEAQLIEATRADTLSRVIATAPLAPGLAPAAFSLKAPRALVRKDERYLLTARARAASEAQAEAREYATTVSHPWAPSKTGIFRLRIDPIDKGRDI